MHVIVQSDPPLEELRRQLRENEITKDQYNTLLRTLPEPPVVYCETCGHREAHSIERGRPICAVCGLIATSRRKRGR